MFVKKEFFFLSNYWSYTLSANDIIWFKRTLKYWKFPINATEYSSNVHGFVQLFIFCLFVILHIWYSAINLFFRFRRTNPRFLSKEFLNNNNNNNSINGLKQTNIQTTANRSQRVKIETINCSIYFRWNLSCLCEQLPWVGGWELPVLSNM